MVKEQASRLSLPCPRYNVKSRPENVLELSAPQVRRPSRNCPSHAAQRWVCPDHTEANGVVWHTDFILTPPQVLGPGPRPDQQVGSLSTQKDLLACGVGVWVPAPLHICCGLVFQRAQADHVQLQFKARSNLCQFHTAVVGLPIYVVPEGDIVIFVCEGDDTVAVILGHGEQVTEYVRDPLA